MMSKETQSELRLEWEKLILDYKTSGLTRKEWCNKHNKSIDQLKYWKKRIVIKEDNKQPELSSSWVDVSNNVIDKPLNINSGITIDFNWGRISIDNDFNCDMLTKVMEVIKNVN